jgi:hypothetical protein
MKTSYLLMLFLFTVLITDAQNQIGLLPQVNADVKIGDNWKVNAKVEGRQLFIQHPFPAGKNEFEFERLDLEFVASKSLSSFDAIGGGYLVRRQDGKLIHRFIQQYVITQNLFVFRLAHRFRVDQTIENQEKLQFRLRYRVSFEQPLNGLIVDPGEFYLKLNNEYLGILKDRKGNLEVRGLACLGYNKSEEDQIEAGADYRLEDIINAKPVYKLYLYVGWYHSF